jgi:putative membrane protein
MAYLWTKTFHLLFVIAWMACVFYLPRILVNLAEVGEQPAVRERLQLMGKRLYRFGHHMFGFAFLFGLALWLGHHWLPESLPNVAAGMKWIHAKLGLIGVLLVFFVVCGRMLKRAAAGAALPSATTLRVLNELPAFVLLAVIYLVLARPF